MPRRDVGGERCESGPVCNRAAVKPSCRFLGSKRYELPASVTHYYRYYGHYHPPYILNFTPSIYVDDRLLSSAESLWLARLRSTSTADGPASLCCGASLRGACRPTCFINLCPRRTAVFGETCGRADEQTGGRADERTSDVVAAHWQLSMLGMRCHTQSSTPAASRRRRPG